MARQSRGFFGRKMNQIVSFASRRQRRAERAIRRAHRSDAKWMMAFRRRQDRLMKWRSIFRPFVPLNISLFGKLMQAAIGLFASLLAPVEQTPSFFAARRGSILRQRKTRGRRGSKTAAQGDKSYNELEKRQLLAADVTLLDLTSDSGVDPLDDVTNVALSSFQVQFTGAIAGEEIEITKGATVSGD